MLSVAELSAEYNDLEEELYYCNQREERKRCARRMNEIIDILHARER